MNEGETVMSIVNHGMKLRRSQHYLAATIIITYYYYY